MKNDRKKAETILNEKKYEEAVKEVQTELSEAPTFEQVRNWVERDLAAANYSLGAILRHPTLLDLIAKEMHEHAQKSPAQIMAEQAEQFSQTKAQA